MDRWLPDENPWDLIYSYTDIKRKNTLKILYTYFIQYNV